MSAERFVSDARRLLTSLVGMGAVSAGPESVGTARSLGRRARGLGLVELGGHFEALAGRLTARGALAFEPSVELAEEVCAIHDRVEALASALAIWGVEAAFAAGEGRGG
ncbi:MAG TPA: hypothetical protein VLS89_07685 [Candidatus Nanopelagicales bacterium]|nr:hypothetical protein [Candidatus Nanopelagicales bacterium]